MARRDKRTESERSLQAKAAAHRLHAMYDSRDLTRNARQAFIESFEKKVDPHGELDSQERRRRADQLMSAHFTNMARKSVEARNRLKSGG